MDDIVFSQSQESFVQGQLSEQHHAITLERDIRSLVCQNCWSKWFDSQAFQAVCNYNVPEVYEHWYDDWFDDPPGIVNITQRSQIEDCQKFCSWCSLVSELMLQQEIFDKSDVFRISFEQEPKNKGIPKGKNNWRIHVRPELGLDRVHPPSPWIEFSAYTLSGDPAATHVTARPIVVEVDTIYAMNQVKLWLEACKQHTACPNQVKEQLPTRVIDVGTTDSIPPKLYVTEREYGQYVALSYCWGGPQSCALTQQNLDQYRECLPMDEISQSIKDAIKVVRAVGLRYLWVDAICIIQDSDIDKNREISAMDRIYRHAFFTLSAESAATAQQGFLAPRNSPTSYQIPFRCPDGSFGSMYLYSNDKHVGSSLLDPLETRAWTFQELILSTRRVVFSSITLKWHCSEVQCHLGDSLCEDSTRYARAPLAATDFRKMLSIAGRLWGSDDKEMWSTSWQRMTYIYSGRQHSDPLDRLIALSGVVKTLALAQNLNYVAGFWRDQLFDQLLWYVPTAERLPRPRVAYRAPSWSWASIDDQVITGTFFQRAPVSEIIECEAVPLSEDVPYGAVQDAWLVVEGPLQQGNYHNYTNFDGEVNIFWEGEDFLWKGEDPDERSIFKKTPRSKSILEVKWHLSLDSLEYAPAGTAYFLFMSRREADTNSLNLTKQVAGLVLRVRANGTYWRIGHFESAYTTTRNDYLDINKIPVERVKIL